MPHFILLCSLGQGNFALHCKIGHKMSGAEDAFSMRKGDEKMGDEIIANRTGRLVERGATQKLTRLYTR